MRTPPRMVTLDTFAKRLVSVREQKNLPQNELAKDLGIPKSSLCYYEKGKSLPSLDKAYELAEKLGVSIDYLVGRDEFCSESISTVGDIFRLIQRLCAFDCVRLETNGVGQPILSFQGNGLNKILGLQFELNQEYAVATPEDPYCVKFLRSKEESIRAYEMNLNGEAAKPAPSPDYLVQLQRLENSKRRKYKDSAADGETTNIDAEVESNPVVNISAHANVKKKAAAQIDANQNPSKGLVIAKEGESEN